MLLDCEEDDEAEKKFNLKDDEGTLSEESFRVGSRESYSNSNSSGWESSISEFETDADDYKTDEERKERFKAFRAQHYFMKKALQHGKQFIYDDSGEEDEGE